MGLQYDSNSYIIVFLGGFCKQSATAAGVPLDLLQQDYWVPGVTSRQDCAKYQGKQLFREILHNSGETCLLWLTRLTKDQLCAIQLWALTF